jgi:hypothetical protein
LTHTYRISVAIGWSGCRQGRAAQFVLDADTIAGISVPTTMGASRSVIDIEVMCGVLPVEESEPIMQWLAALPYPWCSDIQACESIPAIDALRPIERFLRRMEMNKAAIV